MNGFKVPDNHPAAGDIYEKSVGTDPNLALTVAGTRLQHLRAFIGSFAEVVRLPSPDLRPVALAPLVEDILALLKPQMEARRIACGWERKEPVADVQVDLVFDVDAQVMWETAIRRLGADPSMLQTSPGVH